MERSSIIDSEHNGLSSGHARDAHIARDRQRGVCRGHRVHVVALAIGRGVAVKLASVPGGESAHTVWLAGSVGDILSSKHRIGFVGSPGQRLDFWHGIRDFIEVGRRVGMRTVILVVTTLATSARTGSQYDNHHQEAQQAQAG